MSDVQEVLKEIRAFAGAQGKKGNMLSEFMVNGWADTIEQAMREPKACYWMSSKWHRYEVHMADDLPCNAPHDMQFLFAFPPDAAGEIEDTHRGTNINLRLQPAEKDAEIEKLQLALDDEIARASKAEVASKAEIKRLRAKNARLCRLTEQKAADESGG